jgi:hypothetical protein
LAQWHLVAARNLLAPILHEQRGEYLLHPVDEMLPTSKLATLGMQHVLVMYAGAVAVPLIIGRALKLSPEQVAMLISGRPVLLRPGHADSGVGATQWFGIKFAGDDGCDVRVRGAHGGHGQARPQVPKVRG